MTTFFSILGLAILATLLSILSVWARRKMKSIGWSNKTETRNIKKPIHKEGLWPHYYDWGDKLAQIAKRNESLAREKRLAELEQARKRKYDEWINTVLQSIERGGKAYSDVKENDLVVPEDKDEEEPEEKMPPGRKIRL